MASKFVDIMFGAYAPDWGGMPRHEDPGYLVDSVNVRSTPNGYRGTLQFADVSSATAINGSLGDTQGVCVSAGSTNHFFVADHTSGDIFESRNEGTDTWQNVGPAAGVVDAYGDFVRFNDDLVYVCASHEPLVKDLTTSHATVFANLAGTPPTATSAARVRQHLVLGGLGTDAYAIRTSAIGDHEDFPTPGTADARSKQAILESLNPQHGAVRWVLGGEKIGIVVQYKAMTRMTYVGGSTVYEFDTYEGGVGSDSSAGSVVSFYSRPVSDGRLWYWFNRTGFYTTDGYSVKRLSLGVLEEALFLNTISHPDGSSIVASTPYTSAYDQARGLLIFKNRVDGFGFTYNVMDGRFGLITTSGTVSSVFEGFRPGAIKIRYTYAIENANRRLQRAAASATPSIEMQTGFIEIAPGKRVQLQGAHLLGTGVPGSLTLSAKAASDYDDINTLQTGFTAMTAAPRDNLHTLRLDGKFLAFRVTGTGAESQLIRGIRVFYNETSAT